MRISISEHAIKRAKDGGITLELIKNILEEPEGIVNAKFGRRIAHKKIGQRYVVVIFEEQKDEIVVVATLKVDRERLKRYGFG